MVFLLLFAVAILPAIVGRAFFHGITWKEFALHLAAQAMVAGGSAAIVYYQDTGDVEVLNGTVTGKKQERVSCEHSYRCHPYKCNPHNCNRRKCGGTAKNPSYCYDRCYDTCYETCYDHPYDFDWDVYTSLGQFEISRIDRQGTITPPRWGATKVGEPVARTHSYENYVKASPDSVFRHQGLTEKYQDVLPAYPDQVYDYWHLKRLVQVGVALPDADEWNRQLEKINGEVGPKKQVNLIVVVSHKPRDFFYALEEFWVGAKKNDAVLVLGLDQTNQIVWAEVMAWTVRKNFEVELEAAVQGLPLEREPILGLFRSHVIQNYQRKPMKDFEYLAASVVPTTTQWVVSVIIGLAISIGLMFVFHYHDVFGDEKPTHKRHR